MTDNWTDDTLVMGSTALRMRLYRAVASGASPLVLHLHGGAFVAGEPSCGENISCLLAKAGAVVLSVDYPLAPQHPFPEALNLSFAALVQIHKQRAKWGRRGSRLFVAGEEAGANIAAALALMARDQQMPPLAGQILLSPMLDPCLATKSIRAAEAGPVGCKWADGWQRYLGTPEKGAHPYAAPLGSTRLRGLAPALVITAEDDPMCDDGLAYARRLREGGVPVCTHVLAAPTRWPDAITCTGVCTAGWQAEVARLFSQFLSAPSETGGAGDPLHTIRA